MSKEYLEALEKIKDDFCCDMAYYGLNLEYETVEQALARLEAIDNAKPSEALECVDYIENKLGGLRYECERTKNHRCDDLFIQEHIFTTIKQYILKAQEQHLKDKAFELIILKNVDVKEIRPNATAKAYNSKIPYYRRPLTDDEFKFLKEMVHRLDCEEILFELPKEY